MNIEEQVLSRIESQCIRPQARWVFKMKEYLVWTLYGFLFALFSISIGVIIYLYADIDMNVAEDVEMTTADTVNLIVPFFWIAVAAIVSFFVYKNTLKTKSGYKMNTERIIGASLLAGISLGILLYEINVAEYAEHVVAQSPFYNDFAPTTKHIWTNTESGLLGGTITLWNNEQSFTIIDFNDHTWIVSGSSINFEEPIPDKGDKIKIIGRMIDASHFDAIEVRNW